MPEQKRNYMQEADAWLTNLFVNAGLNPESERLSEMRIAVKRKLLESYRNDQAAGPAKRRFTPRAK